MSARIFKAVAVSVAAAYGLSFAGGDWNPTGTSNTTQAISRSGNVSTTGNIGVGTTQPTYKLDVNGSFHVENGYKAEFSNSGTASQPAITFKDNIGTGVFNNGQNLGFATNASERMRISQEGTVGIGTTSPTSGYKLDINGKMKVADNNQAIFSGGTSVTNPAISFNGDDNTGIFHPTGYDVVAIGTAGQERMRINDQGRVGIGTTNPNANYLLHVNGGTLVGGQLNVSNIPALGSAATLFLVANSGVISSRTASQVLSDIGAGGGGGAHGVTVGRVPYANSATTWATSPMSVNAGGWVGIGTTSPVSTFDVNGSMHATGDMSFDGTVSANKIFVLHETGVGNAAEFYGTSVFSNKVAIGQAEVGTEMLEVNGNIKCSAVKINNWTIEAPDYVFEKDYKLPSLKSDENHIAAQKHLPGIPSASEMKKNGVDLSQMNMTLLQKVEELTLYVIEQNKKIEALQKANFAKINARNRGAITTK